MKKILLLALLTIFATFMFAEDFTINLVDSYGDGWNGGMVDVTVAGTLVLDDITIETGTDASFTYAVANGDEVVIAYTPGSWSNENSYNLVNNIGIELYTSPAPPEDTYTFTVEIAAGNTPEAVTNPMPLDGAIGVTLDTGLTWDFGEYTTSYDLYFGADVLPETPVVVDAVAGTTGSYTPDALAYGTMYFWKIVSKNSDGTRFETEGPVWSFQTEYLTTDLPIVNNFDTDMGDFANNSSNNIDWSINDTLYYEGTGAVFTTYENNNNNILQSTATFDLTSVTNPQLSFWHIAKTEGNYDKCYIEISTDSGATWEFLPVDSYIGESTEYATGSEYFDEDSYSDWGTGAEPIDTLAWKQESFDLSSYNSTENLLRFRLQSDSSVQRWGWLIDNLEIDGGVNPPETPAVFFSEYIEGSSNNKALEIYNGTDADVDLSDFAVVRYNNGNSGIDDENLYPLEGTLAAGAVYIMANASADQTILDFANVLSEVTYYNGDDYLGLVYDSNSDGVFDNATEVIDVFGVLGVDPGDGWEVAGVADATKNHTLVRKASVVAGNVDWVASAGTDADDSEWIVYDEDTFSYLGTHGSIDMGIITGTVTIDGFGDITMAAVSAGDSVAYADESGVYSLNVPVGTYDVIAVMSGYENVTVSGIECFTDQTTENVDFALTVIEETLWPPVNLGAAINGSDVVLDWTAPTQYGWNGYYDGAASLTWAAGERAVFYDVTDFGFSYPMELSEISHGFYHHPAYPWGDDTTFTFKIYDADGTTVLFESDVLTALEQWNDTVLTLDTPLTVTDNFWVSVAVTNMETGFPSSLFDSDTMNLHGYLGTPGEWAEYADWATMVYIDGADGRVALSYRDNNKVVNTAKTSAIKPNRMNSVKLNDTQETNSRDLLSFNIFRDGVQINDTPVYDVTYTDEGVEAGSHTYYATAIWNFGESEASNTATVDLSYGNLSGTVTEAASRELAFSRTAISRDRTPVVGAVISAGGYSATTGDDGTYLIENMLVGTYEVSCSAVGYLAVDPQTTEITDSNTSVIDFALSQASGTIAFVDDFEAGADNWVFDAESTWGLSEEGAHSPTHCMTESPNADYAASQNISSTLATPWDLSGVFGAELSFWYQSDIETGFDYMYLEVSTDGENWANLVTYDEEDGAWQQAIIPMGGFVGAGYETVSIRFRFESDGGYETVGMLIDDVTLTTFDTDTFAPFISHAGPEFYEGTAEDFVFDATIIDISGIASANVVYSVDGGEGVVAANTSVDGNVYTFTIPAQTAGSQVDYAIQAIDTVGNEALVDGFAYIAGVHIIQDNGIVDFFTDFAEGTGGAELIINPAGNQLNLAYALIRNYTDQSDHDNDDFEFHIWSVVDGAPGEDIITPFVVTPEASYANTSAMTRIDLRPYADQLTDIQGNFFIGLLVNQGGENGHVYCTISQPQNYPGSSFVFNGTEWGEAADTDYHFRAVVELIEVASGTVAGVVSDGDGEPIVGATVTIGTATGITTDGGAYSIIADPGTQDVTCEMEGYEVFTGTVDVVNGETTTLDITMNMILWAPQNLTYSFNDPNVVLQWDVPAAGAGDGDEVAESFDTEIPADWGNVDNDGDGEIWFIYDLEDVPHTGAACLASASWTSAAGALSPDNFLISPEIAIGGASELHFWAAAQDPAYPADHYSVKVSTSGTDVANFTDEVFNETLADDVWHEIVVDLSDYAGQTINIAWQHHDSYDNFYMKIDDISVVNAVTREVAYAEGFENLASENTLRKTTRNERSLDGYNVYINDELQNDAPIAATYYVDLSATEGNVYYVTAVYTNPDGESAASNTVTFEDNDGNAIEPVITSLNGNYPNPFNPKTAISFSVSETSKVSIVIYNILGQKVKTMVNDIVEAGNHTITWNGTTDNGKTVGSGMYFYKMKNGRYTSTKKMILIK